jgi:hypothetical protein
MNVETILTTFLASSASATVVVFLSKSLLKLWLDKDLEAYRAQLGRESAREVEQLRAQLQRVAVEHEVRFSRLHAKRTSVIATIFSSLRQSRGDSISRSTRCFPTRIPRGRRRTRTFRCPSV